MVQLQRQTLFTTAEDSDPQEIEWVGSNLQGCYEAALRVAHQRVLDTAKALQSDIERLGNEWRRSRAWSCSQSRSQFGMCSIGTDPGPILEIVPGATPGASLGVMLGPTARATLMVVYGVYAPSPQMDLHPKGE